MESISFCSTFLIENKNAKANVEIPVVKKGIIEEYSFKIIALKIGITNKKDIYFDIIPRILSITLYLIS